MEIKNSNPFGAPGDDDESYELLPVPREDPIAGFYYLHQNGTLHWKPLFVVQSDPEYLNSPFVKKVWQIRKVDRTGDVRRMLEEAKARYKVEDGELRRVAMAEAM